MVKKGKKDERTSVQPTRDAVDWYVKSDSGRLDALTQARKRRWISSPPNRREYAAVFRMCKQILELPRPSVATRSQLLADRAQDPADAD